jgi:hypothetical protein
MMEWAEEQNVQWSDYFRLVNTPRAVAHIQQGKISPWLVLGCAAGKKMLKCFQTSSYRWCRDLLIRCSGTTNLKTILRM